MRMLIPMKVVPNGLPICRSVAAFRLEFLPPSLPLSRDVFRRNSWVTATPTERKLKDVRSHARNVRSGTDLVRNLQVVGREAYQ